MKPIFDLFKNHRHALIWTACYVCAMWVILKSMFNFDMFSAYQWHKLLNAQLHGFAGFVFGILILAAGPLYIATTTLIVRKKAPLVTIPKPKFPQCIKRPLPEPEKKEEEKKPVPKPERSDIPLEMHAAFARARHRIAVMPNPTITAQPKPEIPEQSTPDLPLPTDFDLNLDFDTPDSDTSFAAPTFTDITFDQDDTPPVDENILADILDTSDSDTAPDTSALTKYLAEHNIKFQTENNIIITDTLAIATHSDGDFWVVDEENWFAAGKLCPSPTRAAQDAARTHNRQPAIYLSATNIMDLDNNIKNWESSGIKVITDLSEIH